MAGIARVIRRVCLLREQGDAAGAARLQENEMASAIRDIRLQLGPDALPESELRTIIATEERRVADAVILSELLVPQLVEVLPAASGRPSSMTQPVSIAARPVPPAGPPAISDLLDAMLAAERTGRPSAAGKPES